MTFQLSPNDSIDIDGLHYAVAEHPAAPGVAYGQEGRAAVVYQVVDPHNTAWALKVFRPRFRVPVLVTVADKLAAFANIPGLGVCRRTVLTSRKHTELLRQHPDLTYAVLMPWVYGPTWMQVVLEQQPFTPEQSLRLAHALLHLLAEMEERGLAHCDLSGPNVILPALAANGSANSGSDVALVDVEQMFGPDLSKPEILPGGSAGYAHKTAPAGLWSANADRFAGAVLLAEILGWCDERVRRSASGESYFAPEEMQHDSARYQRMLTSLRDYWGASVAGLFEHAWHSETLGDCPTFGEWLVTLPQSAMSLERAETVAESPPETVAAEEPNPQTDHKLLRELWPETFSADDPLSGTIEAPDSSLQALMVSAQRKVQASDSAGALEDYQRAYTLDHKDSGMAAELQPIIRDLEAQLHPSPLQPQPQSRPWRQSKKVNSGVLELVGIVLVLVGLVAVLVTGGLLWGLTSANNVRLAAEAGTAVAMAEIAIATTEQAQQTATSQAQQTATFHAQFISTTTAQAQSTETAMAQARFTSTAQARATARAQAQAGKAYSVSAASDWQDTGIPIQAGDIINISYTSGNWAVCVNCPGLDAGGFGYRDPNFDVANIVADCFHGALIARISGTRPFCVGREVSRQASTSGNLELRINDQVTSDNSGAISVTIQVNPAETVTITKAPGVTSVNVTATSKPATIPAVTSGGTPPILTSPLCCSGAGGSQIAPGANISKSAIIHYEIRSSNPSNNHLIFQAAEDWSTASWGKWNHPWPGIEIRLGGDKYYITGYSVTNPTFSNGGRIGVLVNLSSVTASGGVSIRPAAYVVSWGENPKTHVYDVVAAEAWYLGPSVEVNLVP